MSKQHHSGQMPPEPSDSNTLLSAGAWIGVFFLFALIVLIAYLPNRSVSMEEEDAKVRHSIRADIDTRQIRLAQNYDWVNRNDGIVRLPIDRAMELTVRDLRVRTTEENAP